MCQLETFPPEIFSGDAECPQNLCNFILALAVAHNDQNDIELALQLLSTQQPEVKNRRTPEWGVHVGLGLHLVRKRLAVAHEIVSQFRKNVKMRDDAFFKRVYKTMAADQRASLDAIFDVAADRPKDTKLSKFLLLVRNEIGNHYDQKTIAAGFRSKFPTGGAELPLLSRGHSAATTRFYFGDAAVEFALATTDDDIAFAGSVALGQNEIFNDLSYAIYFLIVHFIQQRAGAFRSYTDDGKIPFVSPFG